MGNNINSNEKYQLEIDNLKKILFEIGQKEHEMIGKLNDQESKVQAENS